MNLYSRVHRIKFDGGYRDVVIHEMLESEIQNLRVGLPLLAFAVGLAVGFISGFWTM